jgi:polyphosphate kinase 2 (PPK2 family)
METLDPRYFDVWSIAAPDDVERREHYMERFWRRLPDRREIAVFDRTWYGRVMVERVDGFATKKEWRRAYDEINQFEALQASDGVRLVKLFLHVTQAEQDRRLKERLEIPWKRWKTGLDDYHNRSQRDAYLTAYHDMFERTSTAVAPWTVIAADDKKAARIAGLEAVVAGLGAGVKFEWPAISPELRKAAKKAGVL